MVSEVELPIWAWGTHSILWISWVLPAIFAVFEILWCIVLVLDILRVVVFKSEGVSPFRGAEPLLHCPLDLRITPILLSVSISSTLVPRLEFSKGGIPV